MKNPLQWVVLAPVRLYRRFISPLKPVPTCRYTPTCSQYAIEAVQKRGVIVGSLKSLWRLMRCNPLFKGGYDPVLLPGHQRHHRHQIDGACASHDVAEVRKS